MVLLSLLPAIAIDGGPPSPRYGAATQQAVTTNTRQNNSRL